MKKEAIITILIGFILIIFSEVVFAQSSGFTVTSVSTSSVVTRTTDPVTVYWIINTQLNGGGQSITGTIDPPTIKSFMGNKLYTKQPLSIEVNSVNENAFYEIINEGILIYKYKLQTFDAQPNFLNNNFWSSIMPSWDELGYPFRKISISICKKKILYYKRTGWDKGSL